MATYTVTGHPLNYSTLDLSGTEADVLRAELTTHGVGTTFTLTLSGANDTKAKGHKVVQ